MPRRNDLAIVIAFLAGIRRLIEDLSASRAKPRPAGEIVLRALGQGAGSYVIAETLDQIKKPLARTGAAAGLTYLGHKVAQADDASDFKKLVGDTLRCAAGSVAIVNAVEVAATAVHNLFPNNLSTDYPRVFISHSWAESGDFFNLQTRLRGELKYLDHSVHVGKAFTTLPDAKLVKKLTDHIRGVDVLLVLAHGRTASSTWVRKEVEIAVRLGKPILAVRPHGQRRRPLHPMLKDASTAQVGWTAPAIARRVKSWTEISRMSRETR